MRIDRIDFTDAAACRFCGRRLRMGVAHIVLLDDGTEVAAGPACARRHAATDDFPDFTKAMRYVDEDVEEGVTRDAMDARPERATRRRCVDSGRGRAIAYLRLRQEKLVDFPAVPFRKLEPIYSRYRAAKLSGEDVAYIQHVMRVVERRHPLLTMRSLQTAYAYYRLLRRAAERIDPELRRTYLRDLAEYLRIHLRLSAGQIAAANRWLEHLGDQLLRPCAPWNLPAHRRGANPGRSRASRRARPLDAAEDNA